MAVFYTVKQTNSVLFDAVLSMQMRSLVSLFRSIRQTQSIPVRTKLDREGRNRRGKGQANAQVSLEAAKRALIGYYYRCKNTSGRAGGGAAACSYTGIYLFSNFPLLIHEKFGPSFAWMGNLAN